MDGKVAVITGCAGFIGSHLTKRLLTSGWWVVGIDNLSRGGSRYNLQKLLNLRRFKFHELDLADFNALFKILSSEQSIEVVFHLAAQVAVTSSYKDRALDFNTNALGSFNILESLTRLHPKAYVVFSSTNKVYGQFQGQTPTNASTQINPYTPYGVSKAVADLYVREYSTKEIGMKALSLRQSCIYGEQQYGVEDQGWLAWFVIANILRKNITIYGDGSQVRDLLFVEDLIDLYLECFNKRTVGAFPVGGGLNNAISINDALNLIERNTGQKFTKINYEGKRAGDQPYFVSDNSWVQGVEISWSPKIDIHEGLHRVVAWVLQNEKTLRNILISL